MPRVSWKKLNEENFTINQAIERDWFMYCPLDEWAEFLVNNCTFNKRNPLRDSRLTTTPECEIKKIFRFWIDFGEQKCGFDYVEDGEELTASFKFEQVIAGYQA